MKVCLIGCGKMGGGIVRRLASDHTLHLYDHSKTNAENLSVEISSKAFRSPSEAISDSEVILIAVKPHDLEQVAKEVRHTFKPNQLLISCLAGVTTNTLQTHFPENPVLRIMPNLPVVYGEGIVGLVESETLGQAYKEKAVELLSPLGDLHWVPESKIDAISSLTGSGPAFVCVIIESMIDSGVAMGLDSEKSKELVLKLISGTASSLKKSGKSPAQYKLEVASPGGTTIEGLISMEQDGIRAAIINAFIATYHRNIELSNQ